MVKEIRFNEETMCDEGISLNLKGYMDMRKQRSKKRAAPEAD